MLTSVYNCFRPIRSAAPTDARKLRSSINDSAKQCLNLRRSGEGRNPWAPAFAGVTSSSNAHTFSFRINSHSMKPGSAMSSKSSILKPVARMIALLAPFIVGASLAQAAPPGMPELGLPFGNHFAAMKARLNLNATQDAQYVVAMQLSVKANESTRKARVAAAATAKAELAKPDPDFARLLNLRDETQAATALERKAAIAEWVKFTQLLTAEQKGLLKSQLLDRVSRADEMREKFRQRHGG